jgi:hypothetical protein
MELLLKMPAKCHAEMLMKLPGKIPDDTGCYAFNGSL